MIDKIIKVGLGVNTLPTIVECTEGDTMWRWHFEVYYESQRWTIPSDGFVMFTGRKADGNVFDVLETIENNEAVVLCDEQMTAAVGPVACVLRFLDAEGKTVASTPIVLAVRPNPQTQGPMSETVLSAYNEVLQLLSDAIDMPAEVTKWLDEHITQETGYVLDTSLTIASAAADAKATGEAVNDLNSVINSQNSANRTAFRHGYYRTINFDYTWESGSINYPSGTDKNPDANVIRIALPRVQFAENLNFIVTSPYYRVRYYVYSGESGNAIQQSNWMNAVQEYPVSINPSAYYRVQIATQSGHTMDMYEALRSIVIVSEADKIASAFEPLWDDYIESRVQLINSYLRGGSKKTAFLFLTDTHWNGGVTQLNHYGINPGLMKYVADRCNIQYLIHGGDLNSEFRSNINIAREYMTQTVAMMRDAFEHVLLTRGNHDDNNESGYRDAVLTITQADSYSYMFRNTKDVVFGETGTYFFHDIPFEKVRIISLDGIDFPYTSTDGVIDEKLLSYGHTQLQWFCDTLASTPADYHIVIYTHEMLAPSIVTVEHPSDSPQTRARNYQVLVNILKAYKNRQNYTETMSGSFSVHPEYFTGTLSGDFRTATAHIVGVFSGHEHVDCIEEILDASSNGIGIYNTCTQNSSALFGSSVLSSTYQHPMTIGTTTELVWDVVVIDRESKHVDMIRIGAGGANTDVAEVNVRSFDYV